MAGSIFMKFYPNVPLTIRLGTIEAIFDISLLSEVMENFLFLAVEAKIQKKPFIFASEQNKQNRLDGS